MTSAVLKKFRRILNVQSYTFSSDVITLVFDANHYFKTGDTFNLKFTDVPQIFTALSVASIVSPTSITVNYTCANNEFPRLTYAHAIVDYYSAGQTGDMPSVTITRSTPAPSVIQATVHGTGGANLTLWLSLNNIDWVSAATITLLAADGYSDFVTVSPLWLYAKISINSIGANSTVTVLGAF